MSARTILRLELATLLALGLFLLNSACTLLADESIVEMPSLDGEQQNGGAVVDAGDDGTPDDSQVNTPVTGLVTSAVIAQASAGGSSAALEVSVDADTFGVTCTHDHAGGPVETECFGPMQASFPINTENGDATFNVEFFSSSPDGGDPALTEQIDFSVSLECGDTPVLVDLSDGGLQQDVARVVVGAGASACSATITAVNARVASTGLATTVTQGSRITARRVAPLECTSNADCAPGKDRCSPDGICTTGEEGQRGLVAAVHCNTPFVNSFMTCSDGDAGSFADGPWGCAPGYTFDTFECLGEPCNDAGDCTDPARPICTDSKGCSATGATGDGCDQGFGCESGLCINNVCQQLLNQGDDCSQPNTICDGSLRCFEDFTCQVPLPLGSSCAGNQECKDFPVFNSCNDEVCVPKSGSGGICDDDDDLDCTLGLQCQAGVCTP
ncbi:MAG: hypothetical protein ACQGVC_15320 [Myxococcota bacterium]